jgi:glycosyltransferase involved in cell wall biosynthesis
MMFVAPGLTPREKRYLFLSLPGVTIAFIAGVNARVGGGAGNEEPFVVMAGDWNAGAEAGRLARWAATVAHRFPPGVGLKLVGPGADRFPNGVRRTENRTDVWGWMSRALAVLDPTPHRVIGCTALESMLLGVPVIVAANGDATVEHAEVGDGGLWFRTDEELVACVDRLREVPVRTGLGEQGRTYATSRFGDTEAYVERVTQLVLD